MTNSCMVREIDIQTIKKEDIPFEAPFQLEVRRNDYIQVSIKYSWTVGDTVELQLLYSGLIFHSAKF